MDWLVVECATIATAGRAGDEAVDDAMFTASIATVTQVHSCPIHWERERERERERESHVMISVLFSMHWVSQYAIYSTCNVCFVVLGNGKRGPNEKQKGQSNVTASMCKVRQSALTQIQSSARREPSKWIAAWTKLHLLLLLLELLFLRLFMKFLTLSKGGWDRPSEHFTHHIIHPISHRSLSLSLSLSLNLFLSLYFSFYHDFYSYFSFLAFFFFIALLPFRPPRRIRIFMAIIGILRLVPG